jgi:hypothetical protein
MTAQLGITFTLGLETAITGAPIEQPLCTPIDTYANGFAAGELYGRSRELPRSIAIGMFRGKQSGYDEGFVDGQAAARGVALATGKTLAGSSDPTEPTVTITSLPTTEEDPVIVHVYDNLGLRLVQLTCQDRTDGPKLIVYDDTGFQHPFGGRSTVTGIWHSI